MSAMSVFSSSVISVTRFVGLRRTGSPSTRMSRMLTQRSRWQVRWAYRPSARAVDFRDSSALDDDACIARLDGDAILHPARLVVGAHLLDEHHFADEAAIGYDLVAFLEIADQLIVLLRCEACGRIRMK